MSFALKRLLELLQKETKDVVTGVQAELTELGYSVITDEDNYVIGIPPTIVEEEEGIRALDNHPNVAFVAHMDTVTRTGVSLEVHHGRVTNKQGVLGADDRAGVFAILETIKTLEHKPFVIFTNYEESGGRGVKKMIRDHAFDPYAPFVSLFVEPDRRGWNEYVFYSHSLPDRIHRFAQRFGFKEDCGSYSDVRDLTEEYSIPHLNISIGYYGQHTRHEYLCLKDLEKTIRAMTRMAVAELPRITMTKEEVNGPPKTYAWGDNWGTNKKNGGSTTTTSNTSGNTATRTREYRGSYGSYEEYLASRYPAAGADSDDGSGGTGSASGTKSEETKALAPVQGGPQGSSGAPAGKQGEGSGQIGPYPVSELKSDPDYWTESDWENLDAQDLAAMDLDEVRSSDEEEDPTGWSETRIEEELRSKSFQSEEDAQLITTSEDLKKEIIWDQDEGKFVSALDVARKCQAQLDELYADADPAGAEVGTAHPLMKTSLYKHL